MHSSTNTASNIILINKITKELMLEQSYNTNLNLKASLKLSLNHSSQLNQQMIFMISSIIVVMEIIQLTNSRQFAKLYEGYASTLSRYLTKEHY